MGNEARTGAARDAPDLLLATCRELPAGDPDTELLAARLRTEGAVVDVVPWDDPIRDWSSAPTVIRSTWDYHRKLPAFLAWAESVPRLHNPASLVEWNADKRYLLDLQERLPVIPTRVLEDPTPDDVRTAREDLGWGDAVLKPAVGLDGHGVSRLRPGRGPDSRLRGAWLLQPFLPAVREEGEISVMFIEGRPTHAVRRRPPARDFRAQERLGGTVERVEPPAEVEELAARAVKSLEPHPLYARVDVVRAPDGPRILELELIEPSLFLAFAPGALRAATRAMLRLSSSS